MFFPRIFSLFLYFTDRYNSVGTRNKYVYLYSRIIIVLTDYRLMLLDLTPLTSFLCDNFYQLIKEWTTFVLLLSIIDWLINKYWNMETYHMDLNVNGHSRSGLNRLSCLVLVFQVNESNGSNNRTLSCVNVQFDSKWYCQVVDYG